MKTNQMIILSGFGRGKMILGLTLALAASLAAQTEAPTGGRLFPSATPSKEWVQFPADGFSAPACGVIYRKDDTVTCGMPLGGIDTGCIDLETTGLLGYSTIFGSLVPRLGPVNLPILGMHVGGKTWVLCKDQPKKPDYDGRSFGPKGSSEPVLTSLDLGGVGLAKEIHYWGHYPVADLEFETDAPVSVGMRAWSPFIPGDVADSMVPGTVFEVRLRNTSPQAQKGTLAFTFPGPTQKEAGSTTFRHTPLKQGLNGVAVEGTHASYAIAVMGERAVRTGGQLAANGMAWSAIAEALPKVDDSSAGAAVAVDFNLTVGEEKTVRFVLGWSAPRWWGSGIAGGIQPQAVVDAWLCPDGWWNDRAMRIAEINGKTNTRANPATFDHTLDVRKGQRVGLFFGEKKGCPAGFALAEMKVEILELSADAPEGLKVGATWDLQKDWSDQSNPNGPWEYGTEKWISEKPFPFLQDWLPNSPGRIVAKRQPAWAYSAPESRNGGAGAVAKLVNDGSFGSDSRIGEIMVLPWASVRWISPANGKIRVTGKSWMAAGEVADPVYTHMYGKNFPDAVTAVAYLSANHASLLKRILAWQQVVYTAQDLPVWLRDSLVNILHLITEDSLWAQKAKGMPTWVDEKDGLFGLFESPRDCPNMECLPCTFYAALPLTYFFPELALSNLRGHKNYQAKDGTPAWNWGQNAAMTSPSYNPYQASTNGISMAALTDRFLQTRDTKDHKYLKEFYPMVKSVMDYAIRVRVESNPEYTPGEQVISMPLKYGNKEWFEADSPGWMGCVGHIGLLTLAQARITERLARSVGDVEYADKLKNLVKLGAEAMESRLWVEDPGYYLNYFTPGKDEKSDLVFGYQLDGEWVSAFHGLGSILPEDRTVKTLDTIKRLNMGLSKTAAVNYANPDGSPYQPKAGWDYGSSAYFPPEALMLAMTYMYHGQEEFGEARARNAWHNITCVQGYTWDQPNIIHRVAAGAEVRSFGRDYGQNMMLWSLPAALQQKDAAWPARPGGLVERMLQAGQAK